MRFRATVIASCFVVFACLLPRPGWSGQSGAPDLTPLGARAAGAGGSAPADINFGPYPLSVLGIENGIRREDGRAADYASGERHLDDGPIAYTIAAIRDWEHRYPSDPWIAKDLLALCRFYDHVGTEIARASAARAADWLVHDYPQTAAALALSRRPEAQPRLAESEPRTPAHLPETEIGRPAPTPALAMHQQVAESTAVVTAPEATALPPLPAPVTRAERPQAPRPRPEPTFNIWSRFSTNAMPDAKP